MTTPPSDATAAAIAAQRRRTTEQLQRLMADHATRTGIPARGILLRRTDQVTAVCMDGNGLLHLDTTTADFLTADGTSLETRFALPVTQEPEVAPATAGEASAGEDTPTDGGAA